jgi:hypothetical protein
MMGHLSRRVPSTVTLVGLLSVALGSPGLAQARAIPAADQIASVKCSVNQGLLRAEVPDSPDGSYKGAIIFSLIDREGRSLAREWTPQIAAETVAPLLWSVASFNKKVDHVECKVVPASADLNGSGEVPIHLCKDPRTLQVDEGPTGRFLALMWGTNWAVAVASTGYTGMISGAKIDASGSFFGYSLDNAQPTNWLLAKDNETISAAWFGLGPGQHTIELGTRDVASPESQSVFFPLDQVCVTLEAK